MKNHQKKRLQTNPKQTTIKKHQKKISEKSKKIKESLKKKT